MEKICAGANPKVMSTLRTGRELLQFLAKHEVKLEPGGDRASIASPPRSKCMADMAECPAEILDYSDASACAALMALDFHEFFSRDEADLQWELNRARAHKLFPAYMRFLTEDEGVDEDFELLGFGVCRGFTFCICAWLLSLRVVCRLMK